MCWSDPSTVGTDEALLFYPVMRVGDVEWTDHGDGWVGYHWEPPAADRDKEEIESGVNGRKYTYGVSVTAKMKVKEDRIDLIIEITNLTKELLHNVWSDGGDLQHHTARFIDKDYTRTYIKIADGLIPLSATGRTTGIRSRYLYNREWYETPIFRKYEYFWGRSDALPTSTLIASESRNGVGALGIGYEHAFKLMQNSDNHNCMHSGPLFGTINPGETKVRRGVIIFGGSARALFDRYEKTGYRVDPSGPATISVTH